MTTAVGLPSLAKTAAWQVLILDQSSAKTAPNLANWVTIASNGLKTKRFDAPVVSLDGHPYTLRLTTERRKDACPAGKFPFSYEVDQLIATPLSGGQPIILIGQSALQSAKDLMKEHLASCDGIKPLPGSPVTTESYEKSRVSLLSIFQDNLGLEVISESFAYGKPKAMVYCDWASYRFKNGDLFKRGKKILPDGATTEATSKFLKLPSDERDDFSPADLSHFVLVPRGGGVVVEFGVPATADSQMATVKMVRTDRTYEPKDEYSKLRGSFMRAHPKLIAWDKVSFYTVAPDQSAVVFARDGKLYWQALSGAAKLIGRVKEVRGWQWQGVSSLSDSERQGLGLR